MFFPGPCLPIRHANLASEEDNLHPAVVRVRAASLPVSPCCRAAPIEGCWAARGGGVCVRGSSCGSGACEATLAAFAHVSGGNGPTGVGPLSRAAEEHARRWRAQIEAAVAAALERRDNRSRARARAPLTAEERTAAFDAALGLVGGGAVRWRLAA
jgi:hypothetical protein